MTKEAVKRFRDPQFAQRTPAAAGLGDSMQLVIGRVSFLSAQGRKHTQDWSLWNAAAILTAEMLDCDFPGSFLPNVTFPVAAHDFRQVFR